MEFSILIVKLIFVIFFFHVVFSGILDLNGFVIYINDITNREMKGDHGTVIPVFDTPWKICNEAREYGKRAGYTSVILEKAGS